MDITKAFIKAKQPCADGFRWYVRNARQDSSYQELLDALVADGRVNDAGWLLDQFGPTDAVLTLDHVNAEALVFAGTIRVRGGIEAGSLVRAGRDIHAGGGITCGGAIVAGGDIKCGASLRAEGKLQAGGLIQAEWNIETGAELACEALRAGGGIDAAQRLQAGHGIECGADVRAGGHLGAGWGIKARGDILAEGSIRAGESLAAEGRIQAGDGYGVYAGVEVCEHAWESSARVHANRPPRELRSGWWAGPLPGLGQAA
ncbi:DUF342 domain-containing protein [Bordetella hinzii]|uniref:DUF342 domain-containing protein n=1 Tax=Bordetella hinzii TaxID=103855 RepID=UPI0013EFCD97|nr:DUF342 domain-containing protein [Bordetella hinzii]QII85312.1 DUF342 domain-containing protein [Bordetella hinzii]